MRTTLSCRTSPLVALAFAASLVSPALAQTAEPTPPLDSVPEKAKPDPKPTETPKSLSDKLDQSNGVIKPKEVDPAMDKPAPATGANDVIKPPGTPGGPPAPQAK
jgi:hypothetical protein